MKKKQTSIDGFIPRRTGDQLGGLHSPKKHTEHIIGRPDGKSVTIAGDSKPKQTLGQELDDRSASRLDIDESLSSIDQDSSSKESKKTTRRQRRLQRKIDRKSSHRPTKRRKIIKWILISLLIVGLVTGGWMAYRFLAAGGNIFQGSVFDVFKSEPLKKDANGRSNFLILGTSDDALDHDGADLTDSMLVVSLSQTKNDVFMFSVPRDLYVEYGRACPSGYQGKINAFLSCINSGESDEDIRERLSQTQELVGDIFGLDIQYGAQINHSVIKEAVDAVGGIEVDVEGSNGAGGILDRNFDWRCNYECYLVRYDDGVHKLDGEAALFLAMARGSVAPTYGLSRGNFDREINQQKIIMALQKKAVKTGLSSDLSEIMKLVESLGSNLRTNVKTSEIRTLARLASDIKSDKIHRITLIDNDDEENVVKTGSYNGQSVVLPTAGIFDYTGVRQFINQKLSSNPVVREAAPVVVLNGSSVPGLAQTEADKLTEQHYNVILISNAPAGDYKTVEIYRTSDKYGATAKALSKEFGVTIKTSDPPVAVSGDTGFVIIFGQKPQSEN
jgi:LCP family protein required for cell wall assembly